MIRVDMEQATSIVERAIARLHSRRPLVYYQPCCGAWRWHCLDVDLHPHQTPGAGGFAAPAGANDAARMHVHLTHPKE